MDNTLFKEVEDLNGFRIEGEPHFQQQTDTYISQTIQTTYRGITEPENNHMWIRQNVPRYSSENAGFLPFESTVECKDKLPLNRTFQNVSWLPEGSDTT